MVKYLYSLSVIILLFTGCTVKNNMEKTKDLGQSSRVVAYELSDFSKFSIGKGLFGDNYKIFNDLSVHKNKTVVVTSLVNIDNLKQTSNFGRLYSDIMITELKRNGWKIIDFRGKGDITINKDGEFYLSKEKLSSYPKNSYVLVGTYGKYKNGLISNLRLINLLNNEVISASNTYITDKEALKLASTNRCETLECNNQSIDNVIEIIEDDCSSAKGCKE